LTILFGLKLVGGAIFLCAIMFYYWHFCHFHLSRIVIFSGTLLVSSVATLPFSICSKGGPRI